MQRAYALLDPSVEEKYDGVLWYTSAYTAGVAEYVCRRSGLNQHQTLRALTEMYVLIGFSGREAKQQASGIREVARQEPALDIMNMAIDETHNYIEHDTPPLQLYYDVTEMVEALENGAVDGTIRL